MWLPAHQNLRCAFFGGIYIMLGYGLGLPSMHTNAIHYDIANFISSYFDRNNAFKCDCFYFCEDLSALSSSEKCASVYQCRVGNMVMWIHLLTKVQQMKLTRSIFRCCA